MPKSIFKLKKESSSVEDAAAFALKISSYLRSGATLPRALIMLAEEKSNAGDRAKEIAQGVTKTSEIATQLASQGGEEWRLLAAAWHISSTNGAPIAPSFEMFSQTLLKLDTLIKKRAVAVAGPKATIALISFLPFASIFIAELLGFTLLAEFLKPLGVGFLSAGLLLLFIGIRWSLSMVRRIAKNDSVEGLEFDLAWVAMAGGKSPESAILSVVDTVDHFRVAWVPLNRFSSESELRRVLKTAIATGGSIRSLLQAQSKKIKSESQTKLEEQAEKLGVTILLPLGVCVLPAFILMGVLPLVLAILA